MTMQNPERVVTKQDLKDFYDGIYPYLGGGSGGGGGGSTTLSGLTDTDIDTPTDGQVLKYDATTNKWVNAAESGGSTTVLTRTLQIGATSVTFSNIPTSGDYIVDFYTSNGINYTAINTATAGEVSLTFEAQEEVVTVWCEIKGV